MSHGTSSGDEDGGEQIAALVSEGQVIAQRFNFNRGYQQETESVSTFAVELRYVAAKCAFGNFLDNALRDRFVVGLRNPAIQAALLKKRELNVETACELARATELTEDESKGFRPSESVVPGEGSVNSVSKKGRPQHKNKGDESQRRSPQKFPTAACRKLPRLVLKTSASHARTRRHLNQYRFVEAQERRGSRSAGVTIKTKVGKAPWKIKISAALERIKIIPFPGTWLSACLMLHQ
ncbi:hypothetical protein HPB47_027276 [Ixodes persulcatus]|uniref:Uncharacterized protein n=1 Tax=Ixodes persulcatus TaxID=34615 RepID=A0AC60PXZ1_IXOPE|nr:hypothetical protein HPB47_027276 [Ixodes persulcatus]